MKPTRYDPEVILLAAEEVAAFYKRYPNTPGYEVFACVEIRRAFFKIHGTYKTVDTPTCILYDAWYHRELFFALFCPDPAKKGYSSPAFFSCFPDSPFLRVTALLFLYNILLSDPDFTL